MLVFLGTAFADVFADDSLPFPLRFEDVFDRISRGAVTTTVRGDEVCLPLDLFASVGDGNGEAAVPHYRKVDNIVADEGSFVGPDSLLAENLFEYCELVLDALVSLDRESAGRQSPKFVW